ncbi:MAG: hypothetical protein HZA46_03660 [Planctomycetales bacterium]|nr:hypothetical protein [Planctomycetales bacterium]
MNAQTNTDEPPGGLDSVFFDWLDRVGKKLSVRFIDHVGLTEQQIQQLQRGLQTKIPADIQHYFENCTPYGLWRDEQGIWESVTDRFRHHTGTTQPLLPIDISGLQGNHTIAVIYSSDEYRIVDLRREGACEWHDGDLRSYFITQVNREKATESHSSENQ